MHKFDLKEGAKRICKGGSRFLFASDHAMALASITLKKGGIREPHWHPNADEMTYCIEGKALITIFSPNNDHDSFTLSAGEVFYVPKGYIHHIENIHSGTSRFLLAYDNPHPEDLNLSSSVGSMPIHVLNATFGAHQFKQLKKTDAFISLRKLARPKASAVSRHKLNLERIHPQIDTPGGCARIANQSSFPILDHMALFSLRMNKKGIREPHWHPNAIELNTVIKGKARLTIFSPSGKKDSFELKPGQGSLIPAGYFHHIENIGPSELHMAVYFNNALPDDIGISGALSAYSKEVLASLWKVKPDFFAHLAHFQEDRMIISGGG